MQIGMAKFLGGGPAVAWKPGRALFLCLHHTLGLVAGTPAYFLMADWPDVQMFCFVMLGAPVPGMAAEAIMQTFDQSKPGWARTICSVLTYVNFMWWLFCRWYIFIPTVLRVVPRVYDQFGMGVAAPVAFALTLFVGFNALSTHGMWTTVKKLWSGEIDAAHTEDKVTSATNSSRLALSSIRLPLKEVLVATKLMAPIKARRSRAKGE
jgi:hypothetical protein